MEETNGSKKRKNIGGIIAIVILGILAITFCGYFLRQRIIKEQNNQLELAQNIAEKTISQEEKHDIYENKSMENQQGENNIVENVISNTEIQNEITNMAQNNINQQTTNEQKANTQNTVKQDANTQTTNQQKANTQNTVKQNTNTQTTNQQKNNTQNTTKQNTNTQTTNQQKANTENTTKQNTNTTTPVVNKPTITGTDTKKELTKTETKYGVVINTYTTTIYNVYSDGTKTVKSTSTNVEYDNKNYNASTSELLPEATELKNTYSGMLNEVLKYVNEYREEANKNQENDITNRKNLILDSNLTTAACARAMELAYAGKFSHTRPNGNSCFTILNEMGIAFWSCGENIAWGQPSAKSVATSWKNSPGHYSNMIDASYGKIGIGVINYRGTYYWVQLFTN